MRVNCKEKILVGDTSYRSSIGDKTCLGKLKAQAKPSMRAQVDLESREYEKGISSQTYCHLPQGGLILNRGIRYKTAARRSRRSPKNEVYTILKAGVWTATEKLHTE